jgi:hypothetical protein
MAYEPPPDLLELKREFLALEERLPGLEGEEWRQCYQRSQDLALAIHRHPWWAKVDNRHSAWMALQQAAKESLSAGGSSPT